MGQQQHQQQSHQQGAAVPSFSTQNSYPAHGLLGLQQGGSSSTAQSSRRPSHGSISSLDEINEHDGGGSSHHSHSGPAGGGGSVGSSSSGTGWSPLMVHKRRVNTLVSPFTSPGPTPPSILVGDRWAGLAGSAAAKPAKPIVQPLCLGDLYRLRQVIANFFSNAVKFTQGQGRRRRTQGGCRIGVGNKRT